MMMLITDTPELATTPIIAGALGRNLGEEGSMVGSLEEFKIKRRTLDEKLEGSSTRISRSEKYDVDRAQTYWTKLVGWCESYGVYECPLVGWVWDMRRYGSPMWVTRRGRPNFGYVASGLERGQVRFAPKGITRTRFLVVDVDVHGRPPEAVSTVTDDLGDFAPVPTKRGTARRRNIQVMDWRADVALPVLRRLRESGLFTLVERTPRGWHFVVLLDQMIPARDAARLAARLESLFRSDVDGVKVEAFPKLRADGLGDHCALPLVGSGRRVGTDFVRPTEKKRSVAIDELLADPGFDVADWVESLTRLDGGVVVGMSAQEPRANSSSRASGGQLFGAEFVLKVLEYLTGGIGAGESYDAVRKVTAALKYCGYADDVALAVLRRWLRGGGHEAAHCATESGLRALERTAKGCLRHFWNGVSVGRCWPDGLRSKELRALFSELRWGSSGQERAAA